MAAICASERSGGRLSVEAPSPAKTFAVAALATGNITDTLACMSSGSAPASRSAENAKSAPTSARRTLRMPCAAARSASSRTATSCVRPCKEADLDLRLSAHPSDPVELCVGEHAHSASLRHAVHRYLEACSLIEDGLETRRALRARNLDPELRPVGK